MKSSIFYLLTLSSGFAVVNAACKANNCIRAVTGTARTLPPQSIRRADCSSFLQYTVTPATYTSTIYTTVTPYTETQTIVGATATATTTISTVTETTSIVIVEPTSTTLAVIGAAKRNLDARQVTVSPSLVPAYASPCAGATEYSSACSCWGVSRTTITVASPTAYTTVTQTATGQATQYITTTVTQTVVDTEIKTETSTSYQPIATLTYHDGCTKYVTNCDPETVQTCGVGGCLCARGDKDVYCVISNSASCNTVPRCTTDSDCGSGAICQPDSCCPGEPICRQRGCINTASPGRLFRYFRRDDKVDPVKRLVDGAPLDPVV